MGSGRGESSDSVDVVFITSYVGNSSLFEKKRIFDNVNVNDSVVVFITSYIGNSLFENSIL